MLSPDKLAVITVLSYEMLNGSNAEAYSTPAPAPPRGRPACGMALAP